MTFFLALIKYKRLRRTNIQDHFILFEKNETLDKERGREKDRTKKKKSNFAMRPESKGLTEPPRSCGTIEKSY